MGNMSNDAGYCLVNNKKCIELLECDLNLLKIYGYKSPSMETFFHSFMKKYTIHLHFTLSNIYFCSDNIQLPDFPFNYKVIEYCPPGIILAKLIKQHYSDDTNIYFLKNHGIIMTYNSFDEVIKSFKSIFNYFDKSHLYSNELTGFHITEQLNKYNISCVCRNTSYSAEKMLQLNYCFPDLAVFIQKRFVANKIIDIVQMYDIIIYHDVVYIVANNISKLYCMIEILDAYFILLNSNPDPHSNLQCIDDIHFIQSMKAEITRQANI
jgi:hypothetical protein